MNGGRMREGGREKNEEGDKGEKYKEEEQEKKYG